MAIYTNLRGQRVTQPVNIQEWTEQATEALHVVSLSSPRVARDTSVSLALPLDDHSATAQGQAIEDGTLPTGSKSAYRPRREPLRRDSLKRREALLKGKEGSRRRQRWENDRLLNNPWAQPPLPSDWEIHPTYPKRAVPYFLAPLWDTDMAARNADSQMKRNAKLKAAQQEDPASNVPKQLRDKLKRAKAAKGLLQDLEEEVRKFVENWKKNQEKLQKEGLYDIDSEDDEIVFVGRSGQMHDMPPSPKSSHSPENEDVRKEKLVFDSLANDHGASFGRWLVHSIASYYGLRTWSITVGDPARREAYVGINQMKTSRSTSVNGELPRPLWCLV